jgi:hypothetical protein
MLTSEVSGLGCFAASSSLAESRSALALSAGPNTSAANRRLLAFLELARELLAMIDDCQILFLMTGCREENCSSVDDLPALKIQVSVENKK